jgi:ribonuclease inhibitor
MSRETKAEIQFVGVTSPEQLHLILKEKLGFPSFYGCNWDASWDSITGLVEMPSVLQLSGWNQLEEALPHEAQLLKESII